MKIMRKEVKRILMIKIVGISLYFISLIPMCFYGKITNVLSIILIVLATILLLLFKCPYCYRRLDPKLKITETRYCPMCGNRFYEE